MDHTMSVGVVNPSVRALGMSQVFAPVDFLGCVAAGYSEEALERVIASIEGMTPNDSSNFKNNISQIAEYRHSQLVKS